nr:AraC family transcriptional regulator [uncultured Psychroserpens sp.]
MHTNNAHINKKYILETPFLKVTRTHYNHGLIMKPHYHNETALSLVLKGTVQERVNNITGFGGITNVIIKPAGVIHDNMFSNDCTIISFYLKETNTFNKIDSEILKEWSWINGGNCQNLFFKLMYQKSESEYYETLKALILYLKTQKIKTANIIIPEWLQDVKRILDSSSHEVIRSKDLASFCGVHPVYLSRAFKKYFGQSIKSYLKTVRVNASMADIINQEDILAQIALKNGFSDQSHFCRTFSETTGLTPKKFKNFIQ